MAQDYPSMAHVQSGVAAEDDGLWRVWTRSKPNEYFLEAFKNAASRAEMVQTVRECGMRQCDIKVMNTSTGVMLTSEEVQAILRSQ